MSSRRVAVLIPALNEELALPLVFSDLAAMVLPGVTLEVCLCDNGSADRSVAIAEAAGARVTRAMVRGYGNALLAGIAALQADPPDVVVVMDGDHSCAATDLGALLSPILEGRADLVLGERLTLGEAAGLTATQRWGNRLATSLIHRRTGVRYRDMGPFRALRWSTLVALGMEDRTWGWNVEMQMKAAKAGFRILELPVHNRVRLGQSKISGSVRGATRAGFRILYACWRYG